MKQGGEGGRRAREKGRKGLREGEGGCVCVVAHYGNVLSLWEGDLSNCAVFKVKKACVFMHKHKYYGERECLLGYGFLT